MSLINALTSHFRGYVKFPRTPQEYLILSAHIKALSSDVLFFFSRHMEQPIQNSQSNECAHLLRKETPVAPNEPGNQDSGFSEQPRGQ